MTREEAKKHLDAVKTAMRKTHPGNPARLDQLDAHLATADMVVDHLFDEAETG
jgi:hypothetical protein